LTVDALIKALKKFPPKTPVAVASYSEGNCFHEALEFTLEEFEDGMWLVAWPSHCELAR